MVGEKKSLKPIEQIGQSSSVLVIYYHPSRTSEIYRY